MGCGTDSVVEASMWWTRAWSAACSVYGLNSTGRKLHNMSTSCLRHRATTASTSLASTRSAGKRLSSPIRWEAACALARSRSAITIVSKISPLGSRRLAMAAVDSPTPPLPTMRTFMDASALRRRRAPQSGLSIGVFRPCPG